MKRFHFGIVLLAICLSTAAFGRNFGDKYYNLGVYDERSLTSPTSQAGKIEDASVYVFVYDAGTKTLSTIYSDTKRTSKTNPISRSQFNTDDGVKFYSASGTHDIVLAHSDGSIGKYSSVGYRTHRLNLDRTGSHKTLIVPYAASTSETDTGVDLPLDVLVYDIRVHVRTADATETMDVGLLSSETAGDADGFLNDIDVGTAGWPAIGAATVGSNETYLSSVIYGALLGSFLAGADTATDVGTFLRFGHIVTGSNAKSVTYTGSAGTDTAAGDIYIYFRHLR